jgi:glycosyltransferase involved in cell wall biosynthesis
MRILMLSPHAHVRSPLTKHTPHLVDSLVRLGCIVEWAPWGRRHEAESLSDKLMERFRDVLQIRRRVAKRHFDALVIKTSHDPSTLARDIPLVLLTRRHVPCIVVQFHGSSPWMLLEPGRRIFKAATKLLLRISDGAMVLSAEEQRNWQAFSPNHTPFVVKNPFVPPRGLRVDRPTPRAAERTREATDFLFVGRLLEQKGVFELIDALSDVAQRSSCRLTFVGDGPAAAMLAQRVQALGLSERVAFRGHLQDDELAAAYRAADVLVLPSWSEGFPTVITEAMFAGLPIVTTQVGGAMDHLVEGEHALFVPPHDVRMLSAALLRISEDSRLRAEMGKANQEKVRIFAPERVGREYLAVLEQIATAADDRSPSGRRRLPAHRTRLIR